MKIVLKVSFVKRLEYQLNYIASDSVSRAKKFKTDLMKRIRNIVTNPYQHRKSIYFDDELIRDLIFKGYTVVYKISDDSIEVFGFVKYQSTIAD